MSSERAIFLVIANPVFATRPNRRLFNRPCPTTVPVQISSHSAKNQNNQTPETRTRSTQLLQISIQQQWLGLGSGLPLLQASDRDQTLGLRSVVPLTSSFRFPKPLNYAEVRSFVSLAQSEYSILQVWAT